MFCSLNYSNHLFRVVDSEFIAQCAAWYILIFVFHLFALLKLCQESENSQAFTAERFGLQRL